MKISFISTQWMRQEFLLSLWYSLWSFTVHTLATGLIRLRENPFLILWLLSYLLWVLIFQNRKVLIFWSVYLPDHASCFSRDFALPSYLSQKVYHWELQAIFKVYTLKFHICIGWHCYFSLAFLTISIILQWYSSSLS